MDAKKDEPKKDGAQADGSANDSLEAQQTVVQSKESAATDQTSGPKADDSNSLSSENTTAADLDTQTNQPKKRGIISWLMFHFNLYMALFLLLLVIAGGVLIISYTSSKKASKANDVKVQQLTDKDLTQLENSTTTIGDPKQTLNVESNAVFTGGVLVKGGLDVAGTIRIGGPLSLQGLTVNGESNFGDIKVNNLSISGNTTVLGTLSIQKNLSVTGGATFGGPITAPQLNIDTLSISKDLTLSRHITVGGVTPGIAFGGALGAGGTASVNGSDTAGTININIGGAPPTSGCFATINFNQKFNNTPHIAISPVGAPTANLGYYITRTTSSFSICHTSAAAPSGSFSFDYVVFD